MSWLIGVLLVVGGWFVLAVPVALAVGRAFAAGHLPDPRESAAAPAPAPAPTAYVA